MDKLEWQKKKDALKKSKHSKMVLDAFDKMEKADKHGLISKKMDVEIAGKQKL